MIVSKCMGSITFKRKLKNVDPEFYKRVDLNNPRRIIRALEVSIKSGNHIHLYKKTIKK